MSVVELNINNFDNEVLNADKPVLVDFWASWCGPCRMVSPIVDEIANENTDIKVCKVNVDDNQELAEKYNVMSIPTLIVFKDGKIINQMVGAKPKNQILDMIK
ncbi:MAG: thioredoxin [Lachnospiraceae bacterium]|nr:thioredoxin [Lachnospiraceae bacterium]